MDLISLNLSINDILFICFKDPVGVRRRHEHVPLDAERLQRNDLWKHRQLKRSEEWECIDIFQRKGGHQSIDSDFKARGIFGDSRMSDPAKYCHPRVAFTTRIFPPRKWRGAFVFSCKNSTNYSFTAYFGLYGNAWRREGTKAGMGKFLLKRN